MNADTVNKKIKDHNDMLDAMTPEQRKDYYASVGLEVDKSSETNTENALSEMIEVQCVDADEVISDHTFEEIMRLIMNATSEEEAKKIFFENVITLMQCKEVCDFFKKEYIDENGKRYTIGRDGKKYRFTADLLKEILDDELTTTPAKQEEESHISEQAKKHVDRYKRKLHDGSFDEEFNRAMKADLGPGKPVDLSKEGIKKACDEFGAAIENMDEILFGEQSDNTSGTSRRRKK